MIFLQAPRRTDSIVFLNHREQLSADENFPQIKNYADAGWQRGGREGGINVELAIGVVARCRVVRDSNSCHIRYDLISHSSDAFTFKCIFFASLQANNRIWYVPLKSNTIPIKFQSLRRALSFFSSQTKEGNNQPTNPELIHYTMLNIFNSSTILIHEAKAGYHVYRKILVEVFAQKRRADVARCRYFRIFM